MKFKPSKLTESDVRRIVELHAKGFGQRRIAVALGNESLENAVYMVLKGRSWTHITGGRLSNGIRKGTQRSKIMPSGETQKPQYMPTPKEIRERAAAIRAGWTEARERQSLGLSADAEKWAPPTVETVGFELNDLETLTG